VTVVAVVAVCPRKELEMSQHEITREDIDALLAFLPRFEKPGREFTKWRGGEKSGDAVTMPFPVYDEDVEEFFGLIGQHGFIDYGYNPEDAARMLADEEFVKRASLEQVKAMLTYCTRGERFCDGHRESLLMGGQIVALLRRLEVIRRQMRGDEPPELTDEDEEALDRVWAKIAEEERRNGKSN
jgi:hypothetical protein